MAASQIIVEGCQDRVTIVSGKIRFEFIPGTSLYSITFADQEHMLSEAAVALRAGSLPVDSTSYPLIRWSLRDLSDNLGDGKSFVVLFGGNPELPSLTADFCFYEGQDIVSLGLEVTNTSGRSIAVTELLPVFYHPGKGGLAFGNLSDCRVLRCNWASLDGQPHLCFPQSERSIETANSILLYDGKAKAALVGGIFEPAGCLTSFCARSQSKGDLALQFLARQRPLGGSAPDQDDTGILLKDNESFSSGKIALVYDEQPLLALQKYGKYLGAANNVPKPQRIPCGWACRAQYAGGMTEEQVLSYADFVASELRRYGLSDLLIESGWQASGDSSGGPWNPRASFPNGMRSLVEKVHAKGLNIGLWFRPLELESMRLDPSSRFARQLLKREATKFTTAWGFDWVKADLVDWDVYGREDRFLPEDNSSTPNQAIRSAFESFKEGLRPGAYLLGMEAAFPATLGLVQGAGIARNIEAERWQTVRESGLEAAALRYYLQNHLWFNDPGYLAIGKPATLSQARAWASLIALSGGCILIGDSLASLSQKKISILKKVSPPYGTAALPMDLLEREKPQIWSLGVHREFAIWHVIGLFNWDATPKEITERYRQAIQKNLDILRRNDEREGIERPASLHRKIASDNRLVRNENERIASVLKSPGIAPPRLTYLNLVRKIRKSPRFRNLKISFRKLGLDTAVPYLVYDFWADAFLGEHRGSLTILVKLAGCRVLAFHPNLGRPQLLSTNRHLTQGAIELRDLRWDENRCELRGKSELVAGDDYSVTLHVPREYKFIEMKADCEEFKPDTRPPHLVRLWFKNKRDKTLTWRATFEKVR